MVVKEFGSVHKNEQVGKKAFNESLYKYVAVIIGVFLVAAFVWSNMPLATTVSKGIQTNTEANTGLATSSLTGGQETTTTSMTAGEFYTKYISNVAVITGYNSPNQLVAMNSIPAEIPVRGNIYITGLKFSDSEITGYVENRDTKVHRAGGVIIATFDNRGSINAAGGEADLPMLQPGGKFYFRIEPGYTPQGQKLTKFPGAKSAAYVAVNVK